jgi:glycosyltransferase involved in cell wall biosynthesis
MNVGISIIICTANRADPLRATLQSLSAISQPASRPCEVVVVDNASTDHTADVVQAARLNMNLRRIAEPRRGKGYAYNTGMREARGEVFLLTDDDVRVPADWIDGMTRPILSGAADAVAGGVRLAPHLLRPWMTPTQRSWLASTEYLSQEHPEEMVGANMAFSRRVLERVPAFDVELGPGALGFSDESLFSWQLLRAGYRIAPAFDVVVEHHPDASRLLRSSYERMARSRGRCEAYLRHHWKHEGVLHPRRRWLQAELKLWLTRGLRWRDTRAAEGMAEWEMFQLEHLEMLKVWPAEVARPRAYERFGLVKLRNKLP